MSFESALNSEAKSTQLKIFEALDKGSESIPKFEIQSTIPVEEGKYNWHDNFLKLMEPKLKGEKILDLFCGPNSIKRYFNNKDSKTEVVGIDVVDDRADIKTDVKNIKKFIKPEKQFDNILEFNGVPGKVDYKIIKDYLKDNGLYITCSSDEVFAESIEPALKNQEIKINDFFGKDVYNQLEVFKPAAIVEIKDVKSYIPNQVDNDVYIIWKKRLINR